MNLLSALDAASFSPDTPNSAESRGKDRAKFIEYVQRVLLGTLSVASLVERGRLVRPDSFRLRGLWPEDERVARLLPRSASVDPISAHIAALLRISLPERNEHALWRSAWKASLPAFGQSGTWRVLDQGDLDYVFHYPIAPAAAPPSDVAEYLARELEILLDIIDLVQGDKIVTPDLLRVASIEAGIRLPQPTESIPIGSREDGKQGTGRRQPLHTIAATEPAILTLARHWGLLDTFVQFNETEPLASGAPLNGFRLLRAADWTVAAIGHPSEIYEYLARVCNVSCTFCYLHGNPTGLAVARGSAVISRSEIETRLRLYDPQRKTTLFQSQWEINEFLVDPKIYDVLPRLRAITDEPFYFITNGNPLKPKVIELLARVKPVHLIVSVNTLDEDLRGSVMGERRKQTTTALQALETLADCGIPFGISLAAFPDFTLADLARTIRVAERLQAAFVRINLPGFTRRLPYSNSFDTLERWSEVRQFIASMRKDVSLPLITIPSAFDEERHADLLAARVIGTVPGSPAAISGLRPDDIIEEINGFTVASRADALSLLLLCQGTIRLRVRREAEALQLTIDTNQERRYPYPGDIVCKYIFPAGLVVSPAVSPRTCTEIRQLMEQSGAKDVWILTSPLMKGAAHQLLQRWAPDLLNSVRMVVVTNEFLGGNIMVMDMCTVGDIAIAVERELRLAPKPDMLLLSDSGFNRQGRDLEGRHWRDLERWLGRPVRLLSVPRFSY